eukprot:CAMPEP_0196655382 /NCGR_PEP_ID=MMETSP1086-20130531/5131_1 /TAXON_ID=77921 /ORGANISM="Cyanoptyche  gloeocystis , Strain SAG4.97" /LENGTH=182 /DNA_ID=CAMNT_0041987655 /DNA_START=470 /DNA_END=1015 /DNA_ORIENTATION=+
MMVHTTGRTDLADPLNLSRFFLGELFPTLCKVIYLDADVLVLGDVEELWNSTLVEGHTAAFVPSGRSMDGFFSRALKLRVNIKKYNFFNAGVLVADLNAWRRQQISKACMYWVYENARERLYDGGSQGPLNLVFGEKYQYLPQSWNMLVWKFKNTSASPKILHYSGVKKPYGPYHVQLSEKW